MVLCNAHRFYMHCLLSKIDSKHDNIFKHDDSIQGVLPNTINGFLPPYLTNICMDYISFKEKPMTHSIPYERFDFNHIAHIVPYVNEIFKIFKIKVENYEDFYKGNLKNLIVVLNIRK
jgi:hypothetical protein